MQFTLRYTRILMAAALLVIPAAAFAGPTFSLSPSTTTPGAGTTVDFNGTFSLPAPPANSSYTVTGTTFTPTNSKYDTDFTDVFTGDTTVGNKTTGVFTVGTGQTVVADDFFSLSISKSLAPGTYSGTITVDYILNTDDNYNYNINPCGSPCNNQSDKNCDGFYTTNYSFNVGRYVPPPTSTPEPTQTASFGIGGAVLGLLLLAKRRRNSNMNAV